MQTFYSDKKKQIKKLDKAEEASPKQFIISDQKYLSFLNGDSEIANSKYEFGDE